MLSIPRLLSAVLAVVCLVQVNHNFSAATFHIELTSRAAIGSRHWQRRHDAIYRLLHLVQIDSIEQHIFQRFSYSDVTFGRILGLR